MGEKYHHGNLRVAMVYAATAMLAEAGPSGVTLRGAARKAGVSQAAPYRHFKNKEALLAAVAVQGFRLLAARITQQMDGAENQLQACALGYVTFALEHKPLFRLMFGEGRPRQGDVPELEDQAQTAFDLMQADTARRATIHGYAHLVAEGFIHEPEDLEAAIADLLAG